MMKQINVITANCDHIEQRNVEGQRYNLPNSYSSTDDKNEQNKCFISRKMNS